MSSYEIVPCRICHLRALAATLRSADLAEISLIGKPRHVLFRLWRSSFEPRAALIEGDVAACWGDAGDMLDARAAAWLFTAPAVERLPLAFFRETRREVARMLRSRRSVAAHVRQEYRSAIRFFEMVGFCVDGPDARGWRLMTIGGD